MNKFKIQLVLPLFVLLFLLPTKRIFSQTNIHSIGFDVGYLGSIDQLSNLVIFPEVFVSGNFFTPNFNWKVNIGYWDDRINEIKYNDSPTYSYSSFVISTEFLYLLPITNLDRPSPVRILSGFSYHYIDSEVISNGMSGIDYSKKLTKNLFYFNAGLEIHFLLHRNFTLLLKGVGFFQLNNRKVLIDNLSRFQYSLGANYNFTL